MNRSAHGLASLGRNGDTMLVHMNPREVASLQRIAQASGTSLTVNPNTGLHEAFNLKSLLPMIAGGIATMFTGGMAAPILAGAATGAATGDKDQSLLMRAGLGALGGFGGAGIAQGLSAAGSAAAGNTAASQLGNAGTNLAKNAVNGVSEFVPTMTKIGGTAVDTLRASGLGGEAAKLMGQNALSGIGGVMSSGATGQAARGAFMNTIPFGKLGLASAAAPVIAEAAKTPTLDLPEPKYKYYTTTYDPGEYNENFGQPGQNYFTGQKYGEMVEHEIDPNKPSNASYGMAGGGQVSNDDFYIAPMGMADGGQVTPPPTPGMAPGMSPSDMTGYGGMSPQRSAIDSYISSLNSKLTAPPMVTPRTSPYPPAANPNAASRMGVGYDPTTQSFSGSDGSGMGRFGGMGPFGNMPLNMPVAQRAAGGITSLNPYSGGGRLLKGPGDGVSDDIPATIHRTDGSEQEARLADGEFVIDAQTVSKLGNGSTEAGARKLHAMMDRIHAIKTKPGKDLHADKHLPA